MWWGFRKSKQVTRRVRVTATKGGISASTGVKRVRISAGRKGGRASVSLFGFRVGGKLW